MPLSTTDPVPALFAACPNYGDTDMGATARCALVSAAEAATPGTADGPPHENVLAPYPSFRDIFFPHYTAAAFAGQAPSIIPLNNQWPQFATVLLCQAIYNLASFNHSMVNSGAVSNDLSSFNSTLSASGVLWYQTVFAQNLTAFASALAQVTDKAAALTEYQSMLTGSAWLQATRLQYQSDNAAGVPWEMFHHWIKLSILGMADSDINTLIGVIAQQVTVDPAVGPGKWRSYFQWMAAGQTSWNDITWIDIQVQATDGITLGANVPVNPGTFDPTNYVPDWYSGDFIGPPSQPGHKYFQSSGSCFSAGSRVLMAQGGARAIETIRRGDSVATPSGPRQVALAIRQPRDGRNLYSVNGCNFQFTSAHPFLSGATLLGTEHPAFLAVNPRELAVQTPTLSDSGIASIAPGQSLLQFQDGALRATPITGIQVTESEPEPAGADANTEWVYDLYLAPDATGDSTYFAGDDSSHFAVLSEFPRFHRSPTGTRCLLEMFNTAWPAIAGILPKLNPGLLRRHIDESLRMVSASLLPHAMGMGSAQSALAEDTAPAPGAALESLAEDVERFAAGFAPAADADSYDFARGHFFQQIIARHGLELWSAIELGWRRFDPPAPGEPVRLAVSLLDLELFPPAGIVKSQGLLAAISLASASAPSQPQIAAEASARPGTPFFRHFDQILYFDEPMPSRDSLQVRFRFGANGSEPPLFEADVHLPTDAWRVYRRYRTLLRAADGSECGCVLFDTRPLTSASVDAEVSGRPALTDSRKLALAPALGRECGKFLANNFPPLLCAGAKSTFTAP